MDGTTDPVSDCGTSMSYCAAVEGRLSTACRVRSVDLLVRGPACRVVRNDE